MLSVFDFLHSLGKKYASSLAVGFGLHDIGLLFPVELLPELAVLSWQQPSLREKVIMQGHPLEHVHQAQPQQILPRKDVDAGVMADLLEHLQPDEEIRLDVVIGPEDVPGGG